MLFGFCYLLASVGFWKFGNTPLTKALTIPIMVAGGLLLGAGISFYLSNKSKLRTFETEYNLNPSSLISSELERTEKTMNTYKNVALKVFPAIVLVAALVVVFTANPIVRAISIGVIAFLSVLILLDSQALKRMKTYHQKLKLVESQARN